MAKDWSGDSGNQNGQGSGKGTLENIRHTGGIVLAVALIVIAVLFVILNREEVTVDFILGEATFGLWLALLVALLMGFLAGVFLPGRRKKQNP